MMRPGDADDDTMPSGAQAGPQILPHIALRPHPRLPWLLMPQGVPLQVLIEANVVEVPNTSDWFRGVVSQRGTLLPVFDLAEWAGLNAITPDAEAKTTVVAIGSGAQACAMVSTAPPTLLHIDGAQSEAAADDDIQLGRLADFLGNSYSSARGSARSFDLARWLGAAAIEVPRASGK
jgi:chemotaxis signal transduction protein